QWPRSISKLPPGLWGLDIGICLDVEVCDLAFAAYLTSPTTPISKPPPGFGVWALDFVWILQFEVCDFAAAVLFRLVHDQQRRSFPPRRGFAMVRPANQVARVGVQHEAVVGMLARRQDLHRLGEVPAADRPASRPVRQVDRQEVRIVSLPVSAAVVAPELVPGVFIRIHFVLLPRPIAGL